MMAIADLGLEIIDFVGRTVPVAALRNSVEVYS
jgi:hypothetical protein